MTTARDELGKSEAILVAAIEVGVPELVVARTTIGDFQSMIRSKTAARLDVWLQTAKASLVISFANGRKALCRSQERHPLSLVQWTNRRSDHAPKTQQTPDVRARKARFAPRTNDGRNIGDNFSKYASEPRIDPYFDRPLAVGRGILE